MKIWYLFYCSQGNCKSYILIPLILLTAFVSILTAQTPKYIAELKELDPNPFQTGSNNNELYKYKNQLGKAKEYLFREHIDSANLIIKPLLKELSANNLVKHPLGLEARLIQVNLLELNNSRGEALEEIFSLIEDCEQQKEWRILSLTYLVAELAYEFLDKPDRCLFYFNKCKALIDKHKLHRTYPGYCIRYSTYQRIWGDRDSSYFYAEEALRTSKLYHEEEEENIVPQKYENFIQEYATAHTILGMLNKGDDSNEKAKRHFEKAILIYQKVGNDYNVTWTYLQLVWLFSHNQEYEIALLYNDTSLLYGNPLYDSYAILGKELRSYTLLERAKIYKALNQMDSSYLFLDKGYQELIEVRDARNNLHAREIEARHTDKQKAFKIEQQNEQLDLEEKWRKGLIGILAGIFLLAIGLIYFYLQLRKANKKTEAQSEELKALDKVKSNFFANISHELRTPLTLILGPLSYILDKPEAWEKETIQQQLLVMQRNGKSLMHLIEEILDLSKLEANKLDLNEEATNVKEFFEYIFFVFEPRFQNLAIDYELQLKVKDDLQVLLDRKKMEKVLNNFLSNAIKFTSKGGKITLSVEEKPKHILIKVSDSGKGVHPNDLPYIFDRFFQSKQENEKLHGGTGIGLALVNEFAQLMQGKVYVESTLGVGSNFFFEINKKEVVAEERMLNLPTVVTLEKEPVYSIGTDFTILLVEDNDDMRNFIFQILQKHYKQILLANNGEEGLKLIKEHGSDIHLVISDVMMPKMDGLSMLEKIKNTKESQDIPVVMLTALAAEHDKLKALTIGVDDYLTKPFSVPELLIRVQNLLYNYRQRLDVKRIIETESISEKLPITNENIPLITKNNKQWVLDLITYIEQESNKHKIDVDHLAQHLFMSKKQLNRKLKLKTGLTPARFIKEVQLQKARKILEGGIEFSIAELAYNSGFSSPATFSTLFKNRFGKSPKDYLK